MRLRYTILLMAIGFTACSRDEEKMATQPLPEITKVSPEIVQSGDTVILTGKNLQLTGFSPEVFIGTRPTKIISQTAETMKLLVPDKTLTGNIVIHLGEQTAIWPELKVIGTPGVLAAKPLSLFAGDTLNLTGENLTGDPSVLKVWLDGREAKIVGLTATTARIIVPAGAALKSKLSWQVYGGATYKNDGLVISVRPSDIVAANILEYLQKDPGMDMTYIAMDYMSTYSFRKGLPDTLRQYLTGAVPCMMFLPASEALTEMGYTTREDFVRRNLDFTMLLYAVAKPATRMAQLAANKLYATEYTHFVYEYSGGDPDRHSHLAIREKDGQKYVVATTNSALNGQDIWETGSWIKILREHVCGNSVLYETEKFVLPPYGVF
jgi:hypothetical protein